MIGIIEHMFDIDVLPPVSAVTSADDAGLVDVIGETARLEAATMARRFAAIAELYYRRERQDAEQRNGYTVDVWDCVCAEIAAAQGISRHRASSLLTTAVVLRNELPKVAAVFAEGRADYRVVAAVVSRAWLVKGDEAMARVDALLAPRLAGWRKLSNKKLADKIDWTIADVDVVAKREARDADEDRHIGIGPDRRGMAELWGSLRSPDALALYAQLDHLADTVCPHDPRTKAQRRADAAGALAGKQDRLACQCGREDCPAGTSEPVDSTVLIHVLADEATVTGNSDKPAYVPGYGPMPADALRGVAKRAKARLIRHPGDTPPEPRYRPSAALADFVRFRDLTCRFPGCDVAAQFCDVDHTVPYPYGPTHASNLKCMCRHEHLLKTFYDGPRGWTDRQFPDGTVEWTAPTGHVWTTKPGGALFFPQLARPTGKLVLPSEVPRTTSGALMMPARAKTRAEDRQARIDCERARNYKRLFTDVEPPPF
jgi:Domain of unknown function (DUF222)